MVKIKRGYVRTLDNISAEKFASFAFLLSSRKLWQTGDRGWRLEAGGCDLLSYRPHMGVSWPAWSSCLTPASDRSTVYRLTIESRTMLALVTKVKESGWNSRIQWLMLVFKRPFVNQISEEERFIFSVGPQIFLDWISTMGDVSAELDTAVPRHELLDNTAAKHKTDLVHRWEAERRQTFVSKNAFSSLLYKLAGA